MKTLSRIAVATTLLGTSLLANPDTMQQETYDSIVKTGNDVATTLIQTLGKNLKQHLKSDGPLGAAKFCSTQAFPLTDTVSAQYGKAIHVKRISLKERNPANAAEGSEKAVLEALQTLQNNGVVLPKYLVARVDANTAKYYKPLRINKKVCLKCHGAVSKNAKLATFIKSRYPNDKAIGYTMGDLRGAIVVTIKQ